MNKRSVVFIVVVILFSIMIYALTFSDTSQSNFNNGTYANTSYNGSAVILNNGNLSGTFISRVFDSNGLSSWNNISSVFQLTNKSWLYSVDLSGAVYVSNDSGLNWTQQNSSYGRTTDGQDVFSDNNGNVYILSNTNKEVWKSTNKGISWIVVNKTFSSNNLFAGESDNNGSLFVSAGTTTGTIYKSSDQGVTWIAQNSSLSLGGSATTKGMASNSSGGLFLVSGGGFVYSSVNGGVTWNLLNSSYGRTTDAIDMFSDSNNNLYILANINKEVWKSTNSGVSWIVVNKTFSSANIFAGRGDPNGNIYVVNGSGGVYKSSDQGVTWSTLSDFNGASVSNAIGLANVFSKTNLTFQVKNCSSSDCSDASFKGPDNTGSSYYVNATNSLNLTSRYFQYKVFISTQDSSITPQLFNVTLDYSILDNIAPNLSIIFPVNSTNTTNVNLNINYTVVDANLQSCSWSSNNGLNNNSISCGTNISGQSWIEGLNTVIVYANDSLGNLNFSSVSFRVDTIKPFVSISLPQNTSYNSIQSRLNYTTLDSGVGLQACWYSTNSGASNTSISCGTNVTGLNSGQGSSTWSVYANDSVGNLNSSSVSFFVDSVIPLISVVFPLNSSNFSSPNVGINYSFSDLNLNSCWYTNDSGLNNHSLTCGTNVSSNWDEGLNIVTLYANDSVGNLNLSSVSFRVDTTPPTINIILPLQQVYSFNSSLLLNFSVVDSGVGVNSCWYNLNNGVNKTLTNCLNTTFNVTSDGNYILNLFSNDSLANFASAQRNFSVSTTLAVALNSPSDGFWSNNNSIQLNYTVNTAASVVNCSLWTNSGGLWRVNQTNSTVVNASGGINKFNLNFSDGSYLWNVYCVANGYSSFALSNFSLNVDSVFPIGSISYPLNNSIFLQNVSNNLNFSVSDVNLQACWYSLNSGLTNSSKSCSDGNNSFNFGYVNGTYNLTLYANDSARNVFSMKLFNLTINYDNVAPSLSLVEPSGTKSIRSGIPLQFSLSDNADSLNDLYCSYNVSFVSTLGYVSGLENVAISCSSTTFSVLQDENYQLNFYTRDRTMNVNIKNINFSVSTSSSGGSSGGGSGGGGSSTSSGGGGSVSSGTIYINPLEKIIVSSGETKVLSFTVENKGLKFLNKCKAFTSDEFSSWFSFKTVEDIGPGQRKDFIFELNIPQRTESKEFNIPLTVSCENKNITNNIIVSVLEKKFDISIIDIKENAGLLNVSYNVKELSGKAQDIDINASLIDNNGNIVYSEGKILHLDNNEEKEDNLIFGIPQGLKGEFKFLITGNSGSVSSQSEQSIVLGNSLGILGGVISPVVRQNITIGIIALIALAIAYFLLKHYRHRSFIRKKLAGF